jgi:uncharacterized protein (TIRG00374 family)
MKIKKIVPAILGIIIIIGFIYKIGIDEFIKSINGANKYYIVICAIVLLVTVMIKEIRWYYILKPLGPINKKVAFASYFMGQITNEILPTGSGELVRLTILKKYTNKSFMWFSPSIILERLYDMFLLIIMSILFVYNIERNLWILFVIIGLLMIMFIDPRFMNIPINICRHMENRNILSNFFNILINKLIEMKEGLSTYKKNRSILFITFVLTIISWIAFETLSHSILLSGFGINISYVNLLGIVAMSWILGTISFIPGGLGAREVVYALMLSKFGISFDLGMSIAIIYRVIIYVLFGSLALISMSLINNFKKYGEDLDGQSR